MACASALSRSLSGVTTPSASSAASARAPRAGAAAAAPLRASSGSRLQGGSVRPAAAGAFGPVLAARSSARPQVFLRAISSDGSAATAEDEQILGKVDALYADADDLNSAIDDILAEAGPDTCPVSR